MLLTRFWYLVLAAVAVLGMAAASIVRTTYERDRAHDAETLLRADRTQIEMLLRTDARVRLDNLAPVVADPELARLMASANERANDGPALTAAATPIATRLRALNSGLGAEAQGQMLIAVDERGVVIGRVGLNESSGLGDDLSGHPLVARAIEGYLRDDAWELQGRVYRMAARPVINQGRYAGAVIHARAIDDQFVTKLSEALGGPTVGFFGPSGFYATRAGEPDRGRSAPDTGALSDAMHALGSQTDWNTRGTSSAMTVSDGKGVAMFGRLAGMAGFAGGGFAVGRPRPVLPDDYFTHPPAEEVQRVPWPLVGGIGAALLLLGLFFVWLEHDRGERRLRRMLDAFASRKIERLEPLELPGSARRTALAVNDAFEAALKDELAKAGARPRRSAEELEALLGPKAPQEMIGVPAFGDLPLAPPPSAPSRPIVAPPRADAASLLPSRPTAPVILTTPAAKPVIANPAPVAAAVPVAVTPPVAPATAKLEVPAPAPSVAPADLIDTSEPAATKPSAVLASYAVPDEPATAVDTPAVVDDVDAAFAESTITSPSPVAASTPAIAPRPLAPAPAATGTVVPSAVMQAKTTTPARPPAPRAAPAASLGSQPAPLVSNSSATSSTISSPGARIPTTEGSLAEALPSGPFANEQEEQAHWRDTFDRYVATRKQCGEVVDGLTYEKFSAQLGRTRKDLLERTKCTAVRFQVYAKDNKATLKASPVR